MTRTEIGFALLFVGLLAMTLAPVIERFKAGLVFLEILQRGL